MAVIGFDTSNYTTSIAYFDGTDGHNCSKLLPVKLGELGLRQSDAVFHHTKSLPELSDRLFSHVDMRFIQAVGVSTRPRDIDGSYMPCFLVGYSHAKLLANALHVPLVECSHQQGHIASAAWSSGASNLMKEPHLAWHLSGGTTELLFVEPAGSSVCCTKIGGTTDISAGQLIDRTGQLLNQPFPSGKHVDALSAHAVNKDLFRVKVNNLYFSLSGIENKVTAFYQQHKSAEETAGYALRCVCNAVHTVTLEALKLYPGLRVLFSGGVASNTMLRNTMKSINAHFATPEFSRDNAMGVAILASRSLED